DGFSAAFGAAAATARADVQAALDGWANTIQNFNYADGSNAFNVTVRMDTTVSSGFFQTQPSEMTFDAQGKPRSAVIRLGAGGTPFAFHGPSVNALLTNANTGGLIYTAETGNWATMSGVGYEGGRDAANPELMGTGARFLPSYLDALVLKDAYGYTVVPPAKN